MVDSSCTVKYLQGINFFDLKLSEQNDIKRKGRPLPMLYIEQNAKSRNQEYRRSFNMSIYKKYDWLCGCDEANALFCFPCLLFGGDSVWTENGMRDLKHLNEKIVKHEKSTRHLHNVVSFSLLGSVNSTAEVNSTDRLSVAKHNEQVRKNRAVLSKLVDCVKFCGKFELPRRGHSEGPSSKNPEVFCGIVEFACELDSSLKAHLESATVFTGTSKTTMHNEILESTQEVCRNLIKEEIKCTNFVAVMCDETTDIRDRTQMTIVLRYEIDGKLVERLWGIFDIFGLTEEDLSNVLLEELKTLIGDCPHKLIAQTYDGAAAWSVAKSGVQVRIKEVYSHAHFVHCYAYQLNLILEKAVSQNSKVRVFFNSLSGIPAFFSNSPQRMATLETVADAHGIPRPSTTCWNFNSRTVSAVHEMKDVIVECCRKLESSHSKVTGSAATGIKRILKDPEFNFWLEFFSKVMPHIDMLFVLLQHRNIDAFKTKAALSAFSSAIQRIRVACDECNTEMQELPEEKRIKLEFPEADRATAAKEVCDKIIVECRERFRFTNHLEASKLLTVSNFLTYSINFPNNELGKAAEAYPMLEKEKLKSELKVLYNREDFRRLQSLSELLRIINRNNLQSALSETAKLLKILITTPMITPEEGRCFSTLKRIKSFLRSTMPTERLSASAMLSIESEMIMETKNFNEAVIDNFATRNSRQTDFIFK